jgi:hypothetical protein
MKEVWRPVLGYEGRYEVSSLGRVKRLQYTIYPFIEQLGTRVARTYPERLLRMNPDGDGYTWVNIGGKTRLLHAVVLEAFAGPRPDGLVACHGPNGNRDNSIANLSWGTQRKNVYDDKIRDGTFMRGEKHYGVKLTEQDVIYIRNNAQKYNTAKYSAMFGVNRGTISDIIRRRTWKHVP